MAQGTPQPPPPRPETVQIAATLAAAAYADERDRLKALDTMGGLLLSANSAVVAVVVAIGVRPPDSIVAHGAHLARAIYSAPLVLGLVLLLPAEWRFVRAVRAAEAAGPNVGYWVDQGTLAREATSMRAELAAAYLQLLIDNQRVGVAKAAMLAAGSRLLLGGLLCVAALPALVAALAGVVQ